MYIKMDVFQNNSCSPVCHLQLHTALVEHRFYTVCSLKIRYLNLMKCDTATGDSRAQPASPLTCPHSSVLHQLGQSSDGGQSELGGRRGCVLGGPFLPGAGRADEQECVPWRCWRGALQTRGAVHVCCSALGSSAKWVEGGSGRTPLPCNQIL